MTAPRFALRLLAYADACGAREELIGDLREELACGRSQAWVGLQVVGIYGFACATRLRRRARLTPPVIALALAALLAAALSIVSLNHVLEAWLALYYISGMLSLFAHMASQASGRTRVIAADADAPTMPIP